MSIDAEREHTAPQGDRPWWQFNLWHLFFWTAIAAVTVALLLPSVNSSRVPSRRAQCISNQHNLALALEGYRQAHGHYPPAYIADANGRRMHSWRVLILPYIELYGDDAELQKLCEQYRIDEPWDGPNNRQLHDRVVNIYRCPSAKERAATETRYVAVLGPDTAWPAPGHATIGDFIDGLSNTLQVVEMADSGIHWMEPRDLDFTTMRFEVNPTTGQGISSHHPSGANVSLADGSARFIQSTIDPAVLHALLTKAGGEPLPWDSPP